MLTLVSSWFDDTKIQPSTSLPHHAVLLSILAIGAMLRFWGLGNVGLHGDEETMAMAAMALLNEGTTRLPSGMLYVRAPLHTWLMAAAIWLFGESEWSFQLPSALVGSFTGLAAYFMGRRFLGPIFNLAFVATRTFMPAMIEIS
jgi:4-amino-4-deoxy-L-arabinose transferase-like glycosyltransferase